MNKLKKWLIIFYSAGFIVEVSAITYIALWLYGQEVML
jgi:hypothetical protein